MVGRHTTLLLAAVAAITVGISGCDKAKELAGKAKKASKKVSKVSRKAGSTARKNDPERKALAAASKKMNAYADCLNGFAANVRRARTTYLRWADPKAGPTGKERHVYGIHKVNLDPDKRCAAKVAKVENVAPSMPDLESAGKAYITALRRVAVTVNQAYDYYKPKAYKNDGFAKGKALHPQLMKAFTNFFEADGALGAAFDKEDDALAERRLAHLAKTEGKKMRYRHQKHMQVAKRLIRATRTSNAMDLGDLDLEGLKTAITSYSSALSQASTYANGHKKEFPTASNYRSVSKSGKALLKAAKQLQHRKEAGTVFTGKEMWLKSGNADKQEGHPAHVVAKYNALIRDSNSLRL